MKVLPGGAVPTLIIKDSACEASRAEAAARELVATKVAIVVGSWCVISQVPRLVSTAGLLNVSAHAERIANPPAKLLQLGRLEVDAAEATVAGRRDSLGLRIEPRLECCVARRRSVRFRSRRPRSKSFGGGASNPRMARLLVHSADRGHRCARCLSGGRLSPAAPGPWRLALAPCRHATEARAIQSAGVDCGRRQAMATALLPLRLTW